ncbi:MAG: pyridoxal phosphate-dependent aminotransferase [Prevotella sp.]|nr:pyridoxal phosphate-dependent aminotransferase [Prevotella sp.]MBQ6210975.1 pyridoxal phosphate-dependent aminotransferase [Prevotella sp.]
MVKESEISRNIKPSLTRHLFNLAKEYDDVVDFTLGDPDIQPLQAVKEAACDAIRQGKTRYSQNAGLLPLREVISQRYLRNEGLLYQPNGEVIVTVGAMEGLYLALLSLVDPGDEVIIPAPYYVNYVQMVQMCHAKPVIVDSIAGKGLAFNIDGIGQSITPRTRAIIINSPANPSGKLLQMEQSAQLAQIARRHDLVVITDEVYRCLVYGDHPYRSIVHEEGMRERTVVVNSLSKEFCMTGYRLGYVVGPAEVVAAMTKLQENVAACAPLPSQYAAMEALGGRHDGCQSMVDTFRRRRDLLVEGIRAVPLLCCEAPDATFYLMVDISRTGMKSVAFAEALLKAAHVALVPGIAYGECCDRYVRLAFTMDEERIKEGIRRIAMFCNHLKP